MIKINSLSAFKDFLREQRTKQSLSQAKLSQRCKIDQAAVSRIETSKNGLTPDTMFKILDVLGFELRIYRKGAR